MSESMRPTRHSVVMAHFELLRVPSLFTALADMSMAFLLVNRTPAPWLTFGCLLTASALLYSAGMVLNDVFNVEQDRRERPERPLPSGRISRAWARWLGYQLLIFGSLVGIVAGATTGWSSVPRTAMVVVALTGAIWCYDAGAKRTWLGPWLMGGCRLLHILLGMVVALAASGRGASWPEPYQWCVAVAIGIYIAGVTWFARQEAGTSDRWGLLNGMILMTGGIVLLAGFPRWADPGTPFRIEPYQIWPLAMAAMSVALLRRTVIAIRSPTSRRVQSVVTLALFSLIVWDAAICLLVCPWPTAVAVLALFLPAALLGRWIKAT